MQEAVDLGVSIGVDVLRLFCAAVAGGLLGLDRERHEKPAGLRTHMLVSLGSATFVLLAFETGEEVMSEFGQSGFDPTRVLQGVVGGIGFLGAGSIIQARGQVSGVTTAASVWMAGALGAAAGVGAYAVLAVATACSVIILTSLNRLERVVRKNPPPRDSSPGKKPTDEPPDDDEDNQKPPPAPNFAG
jgi:putative Mg2+ transporter-C (MgtC) family protein